MATLFFTLGILLWTLAISIHLYGTLACLRHFDQQPIPPDTPYRLIPISILKPLKGVDSGLALNLESFFQLDYPKFELIFSVGNSADPAISIVDRLMQKYPEVQAKLIIGQVEVGKNPKINNLIRSYQNAAHSWILISDSNIRVSPNYLKKLADQIDAGTGMITSVVLGTAPSSLGGELEAVHLNTFYAKAMVLASRAGRDCVVGKSMLFRKDVAERFGGLSALGGYLAEDYMAGEAVKQLGFKVSTAWQPVPQYIGNHSLTDYWQRHVRWGRIRKSQAPLVFPFELLGSSLTPGLLFAASVSSWINLPWPILLTLHTCLWATLDLTILHAVGARIHAKTLYHWLVREVLAVPLWIHIVSGNSVMWRGEHYHLNLGGILVDPKASSNA